MDNDQFDGEMYPGPAPADDPNPYNLHVKHALISLGTWNEVLAPVVGYLLGAWAVGYATSYIASLFSGVSIQPSQLQLTILFTGSLVVLFLICMASHKFAMSLLHPGLASFYSVVLTGAALIYSAHGVPAVAVIALGLAGIFSLNKILHLVFSYNRRGYYFAIVFEVLADIIIVTYFLHFANFLWHQGGAVIPPSP